MIVLDAFALVDAVLDQPTAGWVLDEIADEQVCLAFQSHRTR